ncbi:MAG TPA: signal peptide peptidase SppA [Candidatus Brocadiia bacterium]|nr:signal peptide peptidase SppA [Candidatus Brocadiia bacterium]
MSENFGYSGPPPAQQPAYSIPPPPPARTPDRKRSCLVWTLVSLIVLGLFGVAFVIVVAAAMGEGASSFAAADGGDSRFQEKTIGGKGPDKIVVIPIEGVISDSPGLNSTVGLTEARLKKAAQDSRVKAVILRVDSPGGGVTASDILYHRIKGYKDETGDPVVACMMDIAASGGYYASAPADSIVAHQTTITGSIGVVMMMFDATGLMQKIGVRSASVASGEFKQIGSPIAEKSAAQREKEQELLKGLVRQMHERFVDVIAEGRKGKMEPHEVRAIADGRIFSATEALNHKLIDRIGYFEDAVNEAETLAGISGAKVVEYERVISLRDFFAAKSSAPKVSLDMGIPGSEFFRGPRLMYLWTPTE